jgi:excisionase family DNA binding protein
MAPAKKRNEDLIDVRGAAALVGRHPETIRRWVWSGRLAARREGRRLFIARADLDALAPSQGKTLASLAAWADRARSAREDAGRRGSGSSAAELVIEDRAQLPPAASPGTGPPRPL